MLKNLGLEKYFVVFAVLTYLFFGSASTLLLTMHGEMIHCPFMSEEAICNMNPIEHITAWQQAFAVILTNQHQYNIILFLLSCVFVIFSQRHQQRNQKDRNLLCRIHKKLFDIVLPLQYAFARGILNPKLF